MAIAKEFLLAVTRELDPYTSHKGQIIVTNDYEVVLLTPAHIQFARYGRGPGKKPPLDPILEWVKSEGISFGELSDMGTAFAIQASIGINGTNNWVPNAPNALEEAVKNNFDKFNKELNSAMVVEVRNQFEEEYKKIFPATIEYNM